MNVLAINPCCRIDKLIAYICTPPSNIEEPMRVILQQMDIVFKCKGKKDGDIGRVNEGVKESTLVFSTLGLHIRLDMFFFFNLQKKSIF